MKIVRKLSIPSFLTATVNAAWLLIALALALTVVAALGGDNLAVHINPDGAPNIEAGSGVHMAVPVLVRLEPGAPGISAPAVGIDQAQLDDLQGTLRFRPGKDRFALTNLLIVAAALGIGLWVLGNLRSLFRTLRDGRPFVAANAVRVRRIAWALMFSELLRSVLVFYDNYYVMTHFSADGLQFLARPTFNVFAIINGLVLLAIAEVFRAGTRLDEEQSLTI